MYNYSQCLHWPRKTKVAFVACKGVLRVGEGWNSNWQLSRVKGELGKGGSEEEGSLTQKVMGTSVFS